MSVKRIAQIGDPDLHFTCSAVTDFIHPDFKELIKDLMDTMYKTGLVGIAAPQISMNYRLFLTHPRNTKSRNLKKEDILRVFINPKITKLSKTKVVMYEGCGSVAKGTLFGPVERPGEVTIEAYDESMKKFQLTSDGLLARVIQHEMDHINGIEFIQKVTDYSKILSKKFYVKNIRNSKEHKKAIEITKIECKLS